MNECKPYKTQLEILLASEDDDLPFKTHVDEKKVFEFLKTIPKQGLDSSVVLYIKQWILFQKWIHYYDEKKNSVNDTCTQIETFLKEL